MDFCDVSLRVLYDFEYTTKYGRKIKITSGERLLLIKKTNDDWWQVIRSSEERPFFVPASYVEEVESRRHVQNKDQSCTNSSSGKLPSVRNPSSSSLPNNIGENSLSSISGNQDVNYKSSTGTSGRCSDTEIRKDNTNILQNKTLSCTIPSSGYNSLCEEMKDTSADLINDNINRHHRSKDSISSTNNSETVPNSTADNSFDGVTANSPASDNKLSGKVSMSCNTQEEISARNPLKNYGESQYTTVINTKSDSGVSSHKIISGLPASDSLENLSLQIELKTNSLRKSFDKNYEPNNISLNKNGSSGIRSTNQELREITGDVEGQSEHGLKTKQSESRTHFCEEPSNGGNVLVSPNLTFDNNNLIHHGSFRTSPSRQFPLKKSLSEKTLKNVSNFGKTNTFSDTVIEENSDIPSSNFSSNKYETNSEIKCDIASNNNTVTCKKVDEVLLKSEFQEKMLQNREYFGSDGQLSHLKTAKEKTNSRYSLDSVVEGDFRDGYNQELTVTKYSSRDSSLVSVISGKTNSERSSNDSLLDIEIEGNFRKISGGTTSDSLVPTDGEDLVTSDSETDSIKLAKSKVEESKSGHKTRKIPLTRRRRVFPSKSRLELGLEPPSPVPHQTPSRVLGEGWSEYDTQDGRKYFYNVQTREKRWKPPRRTHSTSLESTDKEDSGTKVAGAASGTEVAGAASGTEVDDMFVVSMSLPPGWTSEIDPGSGQACYTHTASRAKWFSSTDNEGRVYFFEENSNKSSWTLPDSSSIISHENKVADGEQSGSVTSSPVTEKYQSRSSKSKSMILGTRLEESTSSSNFSMQWPQLLGGTMCILKEGPLNRTKITENGKRVRKNWTSTYAVLTELLLLFFKDNKGFSSMMSGKGGPELSVDLNGAVIDGGDKVSSRKNVYMLSTVLGLQVLIQSDCATSAEQWLAAVRAVINNLPSSIEGKGPRTKPESPVEESKPVIRIGRSKSMKLKNKSASIEDLSNVAERQTKIKEKLKKFFNRRPTRELLVRKGIYKDEPVFGGLLEHTCPTEPPRVPLFVHHCVQCVERSEDNMKTDGLYRVSGNLSQVQKIRLQVDQNTYTLLEQEEDVHVLAGTLKLFFRELRQPLIPYKFFDKALRASTNSNYNEKIKDFRDIVKSLPSCNHDTLKFLLQHLLRVTQYQEFNRMHIPNIAIVFGPTLMWPEQESQNMAFDMMQQNLVIECFLSEFHNIFR